MDRGFKFSTYACRAILKAFSRTALKSSRHRTRFPVEFEPEMEKSDWTDRRRDAVEEDCIDELKAIVNRNLADLSQVEETVIRRRFNWESTEETPLTLEEVGRPGAGVVAHLAPATARQLGAALRTALRDVGEDPDG